MQTARDHVVTLFRAEGNRRFADAQSRRDLYEAGASFAAAAYLAGLPEDDEVVRMLDLLAPTKIARPFPGLDGRCLIEMYGRDGVDHNFRVLLRALVRLELDAALETELRTLLTTVAED